jgi:hypothetical protein
MAGKMQNWVAKQRKDLSAAEFDAWVAGNIKVQSWLNKQAKVPAAIRALDELQNTFLKKVMGPGLVKASDFLARMEKSAAQSSSKTGVLAQSIGSIAPKFYPATFMGYIASGPRRGYARIVAPVQSKSGSVKFKRLSKKATENTQAGHLQNPVAYAKYLIAGRKAIVAGQRGSGKKALMSFTGQFFGHSVKEAAPRDFMATAESAADEAAKIATDEMTTRLENTLPGGTQ